MAFRWIITQRPCSRGALSLPRPTNSTTSRSARFHQPAPVFASSQQMPISQTGRSRHASTNSASNTIGASIAITPDVTNYYTIFPKTVFLGPPPASPFAIPANDLKREFNQLQRLVHPDKHLNGMRDQDAKMLSARVNQAYHTLSDPLRRSQYILSEWYGIDVTAENTTTTHDVDPEILMQIIEVQETVELVGATDEEKEQVMILTKENEKRIRTSVEYLGKAFEIGDIEAAKKECIRLRFWYSVGRGLRDWEPGDIEIRLIH